ncbi:MAG: lipoprotein-releasing ABC transporter ATP-binding protein LolD [Gammaproteobacteria bacterium]
MSDPSVLRCSGLSKRFREGVNSIQIFSELDMEITNAERVAIIGSSGAGKSTLLHIMGGLDDPTQGQVWINGENINQAGQARRGIIRNRYLGFVYQFHHLLPEFTTLENVAMPLLIRGEQTEFALSEAGKMLNKIGLENRVTHKPGELSGGERQRAAVARALVTQPKCVLADEPTGNLDNKNANNIYGLIIELNKELKTSFVVVTHESRLAERMDRVLLLDEGRLIEQ